MIYNLFLFFLWTPFIAYERYSPAVKVLAIFVFSVFVILIFGIRYGIGNDYFGYVNMYENISNSVDIRTELGFKLLFRTVNSFQYGFIVAIAISSLATFLGCLVALRRYGSPFWAIFFIFTAGLVFMMNDQVRQCMAIAVFLFGVRYIEQRKFIRYLAALCFGALFHYYVLALIPLYFIPRLRLHGVFWTCIILGMLFLHYMGAFARLQELLFQHIPMFAVSHYQGKDRFFVAEEGSGLTLLIWAIPVICLSYVQRLTPNATVFNLGAIALILHIAFFEYHLLSRFSSYVIWVNLITFVWFCSRLKLYDVRLLMMAGWFLAYFELVLFLEAGKHGAFPYDSILLNPSWRYQF